MRAQRRVAENALPRPGSKEGLTHGQSAEASREYSFISDRCLIMRAEKRTRHLHDDRMGKVYIPLLMVPPGSPLKFYRLVLRLPCLVFCWMKRLLPCPLFSGQVLALVDRVPTTREQLCSVGSWRGKNEWCRISLVVHSNIHVVRMRMDLSVESDQVKCVRTE